MGRKIKTGVWIVISVAAFILLVQLISPLVQPVPIQHVLAKNSLQHARMISLSLRSWHEDEQRLPDGSNANEFLAELIPDCETESIFHVKNSPWHGTGEQPVKPDNLWETTTPAGRGLAPGENAYAVNRNANLNYPDKTPLLLTCAGTVKKKSLIIVYADGSGEILNLEDHETYEPGSTTVLDRFPDADWLLPAPPQHAR